MACTSLPDYAENDINTVTNIARIMVQDVSDVFRVIEHSVDSIRIRISDRITTIKNPHYCGFFMICFIHGRIPQSQSKVTDLFIK